MRVDNGQGVSVVALLWPTADTWPPEIDFTEDNGAAPRTYDTATEHWGTATDPLAVNNTLAVNLTQWHTVGVEWSPGKIVYTMDGTPWATETNANVSDVPMQLAIQTQAWQCGSEQLGTVRQQFHARRSRPGRGLDRRLLAGQLTNPALVRTPSGRGNSAITSSGCLNTSLHRRSRGKVGRQIEDPLLGGLRRPWAGAGQSFFVVSGASDMPSSVTATVIIPTFSLGRWDQLVLAVSFREGADPPSRGADHLRRPQPGARTPMRGALGSWHGAPAFLSSWSPTGSSRAKSSQPRKGPRIEASIWRRVEPQHGSRSGSRGHSSYFWTMMQQQSHRGSNIFLPRSMILRTVAVGGAPLPRYETGRPRWFPANFDWVFGCAYAGLPTELGPYPTSDRGQHVRASGVIQSRRRLPVDRFR